MNKNYVHFLLSVFVSIHKLAQRNSFIYNLQKKYWMSKYFQLNKFSINIEVQNGKYPGMGRTSTSDVDHKSAAAAASHLTENARVWHGSCAACFCWSCACIFYQVNKFVIRCFSLWSVDWTVMEKISIYRI